MNNNKYADKDMENAMNLFLNQLAQNIDEKLDFDGSKYDQALKYAKNNGIDTKSVKELAKVCSELNAKKDVLMVELVNAEEKDDEDKMKGIEMYKELSDLNIGFLSLIMDQRNKNGKT